MKFAFIILPLSFIWLFSEILLGILKRAPGDKSAGHDKASMRVLWTAIIISVTIGVYMGLSSFGYIPGLRNYAFNVGVAFIILGLVIRWIAILTLRRYFTVDVAIMSDHKIIERGLYKYIRHPSYTGSLLSFLGLGLAFSNWISILLIVIPIFWAFRRRIGIEEAALLQTFGVDYQNYMSRTRRLLPGIY